MIFNNFRINRKFMLGKYTKVSKSGVFKRRGNPKVAYATMMWVRCWLIRHATEVVGRGLIVGIRYNMVRT